MPTTPTHGADADAAPTPPPVSPGAPPSAPVAPGAPVPTPTPKRAAGHFEFFVQLRYQPAAEPAEKYYSESRTDHEGRAWRLLWFPGGHTHRSAGKVAVFLELCERSRQRGAPVPRLFTLELTHPTQPEQSHAKPQQSHVFSELNVDWGFADFGVRNDQLNLDGFVARPPLATSG